MPRALPLTTKISQSSAGATKFRLNISQFGDGYSQRTPDGINYQTKSWTINYENITTAELTTIRTFINKVGDGEYFTWTPPDESTSLKWILTGDVKLIAHSGNVWSVSLQIQQVFDL